jgi:hypothetical protein
MKNCRFFHNDLKENEDLSYMIIFLGVGGDYLIAKANIIYKANAYITTMPLFSSKDFNNKEKRGSDFSLNLKIKQSERIKNLIEKKHSEY